MIEVTISCKQFVTILRLVFLLKKFFKFSNFDRFRQSTLTTYNESVRPIILPPKISCIKVIVKTIKLLQQNFH